MYNRKDAFYRKAKKEGYKSRAAYKLTELNKKYALYNPNSRVLDAGCSPGGWSQIVLETVKKQPVVGVDLIQVEGMGHPNFHFVLGDLTDNEVLLRVLAVCPEFDTVLSDAAPNTSGTKLLDHVNSCDLVKIIFDFTKKVLRKNGNFCFKLFDGEDTQELLKAVRKCFSMVKVIRPSATRKSSFEIYVVCKGYTGEKE
ncbi:RlmE family RNA methyltransferase [Geovibrio thiophilus]|uniref:Ribosomal RNA large subunit methyltransferase E n=1 Tax=Geovibrio thiophilus TaxID=139438 RepID=A0A410JUY1_9BACT|nr:RlmE family RNA methyltransferase [Geovibrio thiophilus]QAR31986.1 RlmE family RNA methyltransferase [Geovibrio thiophilus]